MKKLFLIAAASATILSSTLSFADSMDDNQWYLKANAGASIFDKAKDNLTGLKMKSNTAFTGSIGAGYYIMDNVRTDVTLGTIASPQLKKSTTSTTTVTTVPSSIIAGGQLIINGNVIPGGVLTSGPASSTSITSLAVKHKPSITTLLLNGYVDFIDVGMFKVFGGGGIGTALVKDKITWTINNVTAGATSKQTYNFAWQASLGASAEVADGIKAELVYMYADAGKSKSKNVQAFGRTLQTGSTRFKGNNVMAGIRFDI